MHGNINLLKLYNTKQISLPLPTSAIQTTQQFAHPHKNHRTHCSTATTATPFCISFPDNRSHRNNNKQHGCGCANARGVDIHSVEHGWQHFRAGVEHCRRTQTRSDSALRLHSQATHTTHIAHRTSHSVRFSVQESIMHFAA